jgi:hypothetical protein
MIKLKNCRIGIKQQSLTDSKYQNIWNLVIQNNTFLIALDPNTVWDDNIYYRFYCAPDPDTLSDDKIIHLVNLSDNMKQPAAILVLQYW